MNQRIYIYSNKQLERWLLSLKQQRQQSKNGSNVKSILFHPQVELLQQDFKLLQTLCPFVESFSIYSTKSVINHTPNYNLLPAWKYTKYLMGCHSDSLAVWAPRLSSQLRSAVLNYHEILMILFYDKSNNSNNNNNNNTIEANHSKQHHPNTMYQFPNMVDLQLDFAYMEMNICTLLEKLHLACPNLKKLTLTSVTLTMDQSPSNHRDHNIYNNDYRKKEKCHLPCYSLISLSLYDTTIDDAHIYPYLLHKYPMLESFNMEFIFDEFYNSTSSDQIRTCLFLETCRPYLFNFLTKRKNKVKYNSHGHQDNEIKKLPSSLKSISLHFKGAYQFVESIWSGKEFAHCLEMSMDAKECKLDYLDLNYTRQSKLKKDILELDYMLKSKPIQQLKGLSLNVYNNNYYANPEVNRHSFHLLAPSPLSSIDMHNDYQSFTCLTKLCLSNYPGFDINIIQLLNKYPHLQILKLQNAILHSNHQRRANEELLLSLETDNKHQCYELQELSLSSTTILNMNEWIQLIQNKLLKLASLHCENINFMNKQHFETNAINIDLSNHSLRKLWLKHITLQNKNKKAIPIDWLKVKELGYSITSWYDTSINDHHCNNILGSSVMSRRYNHRHSAPANSDNSHDHEVNRYIQVICQYVEDVLFC
ncbi:hypothetical protein BJ944DRAFT_263635 [Cunninghamella echinulata]|nr:hypothetical protein BJ944DRAFT_263635 [Cunninghamella echinulata]